LSRAIVLGGLGFIGHHLVQELANEGIESIIIDSMRPHTPSETYAKRISKVKGQKILETEIAILEGISYNIDYVFHLANVPNQKLVMKNPSNAIKDIENLWKLLQMCHYADASKFIYVSSSMVYGDFTEIPQPEDGFLQPVSAYGEMKRISEDNVRAYCWGNDIDWAVVRPSAVYGDNDNLDRVVSKFIHSAMRGETLKVEGDDKLDFTYVKDLAQGMVKIALNGYNDVYNVTYGESRSLLELAEIVTSVVGSGKIKKTERDGNYPVRGSLDISKVKELGYKPRYNLEQGIIRYYDSIQRSA
jgi:nucleoside-diphosphate-sugar epimerase